MEENVEELLKDKDEDVVQFNFENNTSSPVVIDLFDTSSLTTIPTSGTSTTTYSNSNDLLPSVGQSLFSLNPNNGTFIASGVLSPTITIIDTTTNTTQNNFNNSIGFNGAVLSIAIQSDGKILCGGNFSSYKGLTENFIIRLNSDGTKDVTFDNSVGFNAGINSIAVQLNGKIVVGGSFTLYKGVSENRIIRLNSDGTKDITFDNSVGFNNTVVSIAIQSDGKIVCGGTFTAYKGLTENRIIRLNSDGTKDVIFDNSVGFNGGVISIAIQLDGKIVVGGSFTLYKGVSANRIIRLNSDATKDVIFDNSVGFNGQVNSISIQTDGKIVCVGSFTTYKGLTENCIIRLNSDATKDITFDNSIGFGSAVQSLAIQLDGKILCGGFFVTYKGLTEIRIIRLNSDGTKDVTFDNSIGFNNAVFSIAIQSNGEILCGGVFGTYKGYVNNRIINLQSNGFSASTLSLNTSFNNIEFNTINNKFYGCDSTSTTIISSNGQAIETSLGFLGGVSLSFNANNNCMYILDNIALVVNVLDCITNLIVATIPIPNLSLSLSNLTTSNFIYIFDESTSLLQKIDCSTNTLILINLSLPNILNNVNSITFNSANQLLYVISGSVNIVDVVDTTTDTFLTSITIVSPTTFNPFYSAINPVTNQLFLTRINAPFPKSYAIIDCTTNTFVSVNNLSAVGGQTVGVIYNPITNSMYVSGSVFSVTTFTATPFFISGSSNYNTFVNNLNFEPIFVDEIRLVTTTQAQLYNQVQFTKIDSNGNQIFFGEFPITKVDSFQGQGNIAGLKLNGLVFDGRTYIYQYVINPNEIVSFEIYYKQLDRFTATITYPIFFKPKIQLKDYIRKDYNNFDVEIDDNII